MSVRSVTACRHRRLKSANADCLRGIAWNASYAGDSNTSYDRCTVHDNLVGKAAASKVFGGTHRVTNTITYNPKLDFRLNGEGVFKQGLPREARVGAPGL